MANANRACDLDKSALSCALDECLLNLARGKDVFVIMPTGFGKSLIFQLFPHLAKAALTLENSAIIVVSPLISIINARPSGTTEKACIFGRIFGIGEEGEEDKKTESEKRKVRNCFR